MTNKVETWTWENSHDPKTIQRSQQETARVAGSPKGPIRPCGYCVTRRRHDDTGIHLQRPQFNFEHVEFYTSRLAIKSIIIAVTLLMASLPAAPREVGQSLLQAALCSVLVPVHLSYIWYVHSGF